MNRLGTLVIGLGLLLRSVAATAGGETAGFETPGGLAFFAGREVTLADYKTKRLFAAGGLLDLSAVTGEEIIAVGDRISILRSPAKAVVTAGRELTIDQPQCDEVIAAGGDVHLRGGAVESDVVIAGRDIHVASAIGGDVYATGRRVRLGGIVNGTVSLRAVDIVLEPGTQIRGKLIYRSPTLLEVPPGVNVAGGIERTGTLDETVRAARHSPRGLVVALAVIAGTFAIIVLTSATFAAALPGTLTAGAAELSDRPLAAFGLGVLGTVAVPVIAMALAVTLVGLPLALVVLAAFAVAVATGLMIAGLSLGAILRARRFNPDLPKRLSSRVLLIVLGLTVFAIAGLVPVLGAILQTVVAIAGLGAALHAHWSRRAAMPIAAAAA